MSKGAPQRGDWVVAKAMPTGPVGRVKRTSARGGWADIRFTLGSESWSKRMQFANLVIIKRAAE
jgi:hypothetical protein